MTKAKNQKKRKTFFNSPNIQLFERRKRQSLVTSGKMINFADLKVTDIQNEKIIKKEFTI